MTCSSAAMAKTARARVPPACVLTVSLAISLLGGAAQAQIYTCVDANGKRLTSDRPLPECALREQRQLNADGSVRRIVPPAMTADERAEAELKEREEAAARIARQDAVRRDR